MANTNPYLTFSSPSSFTLATKNKEKSWDGTLEYSTDLKNWTTWDGTTTLNSSDGAEYVLYIRGTGNSAISYDTGNSWIFAGSNISCSGNIENLLDHEIVATGGHPSMSETCYYYMFAGCTSLMTAPELPATTLAMNCYEGMFYGCTSLTEAPELPATTLADFCYTSMFSNCTSLTTPPELPATILANICYMSMFSNCTSLMTPPELPATTLTNWCYYHMFEGCTNLKLSTTQVGKYTTQYRIPSSEIGETATDALTNMFTDTGGTFTGTPDINATYYLYTIPKYVDSINLRGSVKYLKHSNLANDLSTASSSSIPTVKAIRDYREFTTEQYNTIANLLDLPTSSDAVSYITPTDDVVVDIELGEKLLNIIHKNIINDVTAAEDNNELAISDATREFLSLTDKQYNTLIGIING